MHCHRFALSYKFQTTETDVGCAVLNNMQHALNLVQEGGSEDKQVPTSIGLAMVCGEAVAKGNLRKPVAEVFNINQCRITMSVTHHFNVSSDSKSLDEHRTKNKK